MEEEEGEPNTKLDGGSTGAANYGAIVSPQ